MLLVLLSISIGGSKHKHRFINELKQLMNENSKLIPRVLSSLQAMRRVGELPTFQTNIDCLTSRRIIRLPGKSVIQDIYLTSTFNI
jgi:hypothetical protein